ncbi:hypothetical protein ASG61_14570 [Bacillus sp. Leaf75]|nr:hypothetical protein ASG61_14570 [Bacillus sp. Leaf75]
MTGRDMFGNKISEEQRKASLLQALGIAGAGALSTKVAGKSGENGTKPCDQRNRKAQQHAQHASHKRRCQRHKTSLPKRQKRTGLLDTVAT